MKCHKCHHIDIAPKNKSKFFQMGFFLDRGFSLLQSEHPLFLYFPGHFFKIFFVKFEAF